MSGHSWIGDLGLHLEKSGFVDTHLDRVPMSQASAGFHSDKSLATYEEFSFAVLDGKGTGEGDKLREKISKAFEECRKQKLAISTDMVIATGRKGD